MGVEGFVRQWEARSRRLARGLRHKIGPRRAPSGGAPATASAPITAAAVAAPSGVETIASLAELDDKLREVEAARVISDDAMRKEFQTFQMTFSADLPADPASPEYAERQFELYRTIAARDYVVDNERSDFPVDANRPFPYYTESFDTVGHQLMALGFIIHTMALPAGASVLDLGAGWGNTSVALARMGYRVTAIDIDPAFVALIEERAAKFGLPLIAKRGTYLEIDQLEGDFDAVLFFESFHHGSDHRELLYKLAGVLAPGGRVFFAAEPISESFPVPWGVRLDGESLWAIRSNGWLELGFQESYFLRTLQHLGWLATKHVTPATHLGVIFEARRAEGRYEMSTFRLPPDEDATWASAETDGRLKHRYSSRSSVLSLEQGLADGAIVIDAFNPAPQTVAFRVRHGEHTVEGVAEAQSEVVIRLPYDPAGTQVVIEATTWRPGDVGSEDTREIGLGVRTISWHPTSEGD